MNPYVEAIFQGFALGMTLCFSLGPSFLGLIQTSLRRGVKAGVSLAVGIFLSDVLCVGLAFLGASKVLGSDENKMILGIVGGTILAVYGFYNVFAYKNHPPEEDKTIEVHAHNIPLGILKGFLLNILNPFVFLLWFGWVGFVSSKENFTSAHVWVFFITTLLVVLGTDLLKVMGAHKIKKLLSPKLMIWVNRILGLILVILGVVLVFRTI